MPEALYLRDAYLREFAATVQEVRPAGLVLDRTAFHPTGGGQPNDVGRLVLPDGDRLTVTGVENSLGGIVHAIREASPPAGTEVQGAVDWSLRYAYMRFHTCLHILSGVVFHRFGSDITGGQIYADRARIDLSIPGFERPLAEEIIQEVNRVVDRSLPVSVRFVPRSELETNPSLVRVDRALWPEVQEVRLVDIEGFDIQADGGTHVRSTQEVGAVTLQKIENKGARNKRLYVSLGPAPS